MGLTQTGRLRKDCPICLTKGLLLLLNHTKHVHHLISRKTKEPSLDMEKELSFKENNDENWWKTQSLLPFEPCSSIMVSGPTGSGKTRWVYTFLQNSSGMYVQDPPKKIMYCYSIHQTLFDEMEQNIPNLILHEGLTTRAEIGNTFPLSYSSTASKTYNFIYFSRVIESSLGKSILIGLNLFRPTFKRSQSIFVKHHCFISAGHGVGHVHDCRMIK